MAYLHCHSCDWEQDDFYSIAEYNPASSLKDWMELLCSEEIDAQFTDDAQFLKENGPLTNREIIARDFERYAKIIREMTWITYESWLKEKGNAICPKCGAKDFDID
jgi:hypothetical protein